jgi:hypothetical protein
VPYARPKPSHRGLESFAIAAVFCDEQFNRDTPYAFKFDDLLTVALRAG